MDGQKKILFVVLDLGSLLWPFDSILLSHRAGMRETGATWLLSPLGHWATLELSFVGHKLRHVGHFAILRHAETLI